VPPAEVFSILWQIEHPEIKLRTNDLSPPYAGKIAMKKSDARAI